MIEFKKWSVIQVARNGKPNSPEQKAKVAGKSKFKNNAEMSKEIANGPHKPVPGIKAWKSEEE